MNSKTSLLPTKKGVAINPLSINLNSVEVNSVVRDVPLVNTSLIFLNLSKTHIF